MGIYLIVIDGFGVGEMPDANLYGDEGSNTYLNVYSKIKMPLPTMSALGIRNIDGINIPYEKTIIGNYGKLKEKTNAKDSTAGHYEIAGIVLEKPYPVFPNAFPSFFINTLEKNLGVNFLGNEVADGIEIINRLGDESIQTGKPIIYTSQDSVLQIAADENSFGLERLLKLCQNVRKFCIGDFEIARVIARPFVKNQTKFLRTPNRHDFAILPPKKSMLDKLQEFGYETISVGKVYDIFCGQGIQKKLPGKTNQQVMESILVALDQSFKGVLFANLVETDMLYGHRNDVVGYADALSKIDEGLLQIMQKMKDDDILIVTADHGCDPTTASDSHSREYVPILVYGKGLKSGINLGTLDGFDVIAKSILDYYFVEKYDDSIFNTLRLD